ncbi:GNAT family acetyltransferase [Candidatus Bathyarchaeota archaeon]|nr:GNAT family acetyltransferase [Candidatus Bathyarchaeota archaeon]
MSFEIVRYDKKHQEAVVDLWEKCGLIIPQNDPVEDIQRKLAFQPELFFIAVLDGQLIGSVMVGYEGHRGWLNYLAVLPSFQKRGYGKKLVNRAIIELRKIGCVKLNLQVRKSNTAVIEFYKHLGFEEEERISFGMRLRKRIVE